MIRYHNIKIANLHWFANNILPITYFKKWFNNIKTSYYQWWDMYDIAGLERLKKDEQMICIPLHLSKFQK